MADYTTDLINACRLDGDIVSAGQPTRSELDAASSQGVRTVVNLRPDGEFSEFDEASAVSDTGMRYVHIPVAGPDDINADSAGRLDQALSGSGAPPALVHCASGNRVGALVAYRARHLLNYSAEDSLRIGTEAGLNRESPLFDAIRRKLA